MATPNDDYISWFSLAIQCDQWDTSRNEVWQFPESSLKDGQCMIFASYLIFPFFILLPQSTGMMTGTLVTILLFLLKNLFIWLHWVLVAARDFSLWHVGLVGPQHVGS